MRIKQKFVICGTLYFVFLLIFGLSFWGALLFFIMFFTQLVFPIIFGIFFAYYSGVICIHMKQQNKHFWQIIYILIPAVMFISSLIAPHIFGYSFSWYKLTLPRILNFWSLLFGFIYGLLPAIIGYSTAFIKFRKRELIINT